MIGEFNLKRAALSSEMAKEEKDGEKLQTLDTELRDIYARMMENENMNRAQFEAVMQDEALDAPES